MTGPVRLPAIKVPQPPDEPDIQEQIEDVYNRLDIADQNENVIERKAEQCDW